MLARPTASDVTVAVVTAPPAVTALKVIGVPGTGRLSAACTSTTRGCGRTLPATPVCPPPLITTSFVAGGTTVSLDVPTMPVGVVAVRVVKPRLPVAVTVAALLPVAVSVATVGSLVSQLTSRPTTGAFEESTPVAV